MPELLLKTPLYERHVRLGAKLVPFAGFEMPVQYTGVLDEALNTRKKGGLFDVSHMGQFRLCGKSALDEIQKLVTNDASRMRIGQAQYNMLCNEQGGVIDDLVIYHRNEAELFLCVNAANRKTDYDWISAHINHAMVRLEDVSEQIALLAIQGPNSQALLGKLSPVAVVEALKYYWATETTIAGYPCYLSRTGYTGEDGFELYVAANDAGKIWDTVLEFREQFGIMPCGLGARDILRIEMGYPLHGHELSTNISPLTAGLNWTVRLKKTTPFIGQQALIHEIQNGSAKKLLGLLMNDRRIARAGYKIYSDQGAEVGEITSGTFSPNRNASIALGYVEAKHAHEPLFTVGIRNEQIKAENARLPFVTSRTRRAPHTGSG